MSKLPPAGSAAPSAAPDPPKPAAYGAAAMTDLVDEIQWSSCECLNAASKDGLGRVMKQGLRDQEDLLLESDADEQLLLTIAFKGPMKVHSLQVDAPSDGRAPKEVKLFVNCPSLDFDDAEGRHAQQQLELAAEQLGTRLPLDFVKFQSVQTLSLFVVSNQEEGEVSALSGVRLWGTAVATTNMTEFKRVAGEKGEGE
mmetsp:Transcript_25317/g.75209  ORF Transcript_25317/g.75209 Transcript_25317/m.75209 type:complete len:198 (+) Transcript_25317:48-641(+)